MGPENTVASAGGPVRPNTRRALVSAYMEQDGTTLPEGIELLQHGCGELHPAEPTEDGVENPANRRVELFLFEWGARPPPVRCQEPGCSEYNTWLADVVEEINADNPIPSTLEGRIIYPDNTPAANVPFVVEVGGSVVEGGYTDIDGRYLVEGISGDAHLRLCDEFPLDQRPD